MKTLLKVLLIVDSLAFFSAGALAHDHSGVWVVGPERDGTQHVTGPHGERRVYHYQDRRYRQPQSNQDQLYGYQVFGNFLRQLRNNSKAQDAQQADDLDRQLGIDSEW